MEGFLRDIKAMSFLSAPLAKISPPQIAQNEENSDDLANSFVCLPKALLPRSLGRSSLKDGTRRNRAQEKHRDETGDSNQEEMLYAQFSKSVGR
jgi:hypothetical protein